MRSGLVSAGFVSAGLVSAGLVSGFPALRSTATRLLAALCLFAGLQGGAGAAAYEDLFTAIKNDNPAAVTALIRRGVDANTLDQAGEPILMRAMRDNAWNAADAILAERTVDVNRANRLGETALMLAAYAGRKEVVEALIARRAEVNKTGWTPLHYAAANGHTDIVAVLLEHHAYIDAESPNKTTPIMMAVRGNHIRTVRLLLDEGADTTLKNEQGMTILAFAEKNGHKEIAEGLRLRAKRDAERKLKPWK